MSFHFKAQYYVVDQPTTEIKNAIDLSWICITLR